MSISTENATKGLINDQLGTQLESVSAQVEANLERGRNALAEWRASLNDWTTRATDQAGRYVHDQPWQAVAGAAVVGFIVGLLCAKSRTRMGDFI